MIPSIYIIISSLYCAYRLIIMNYNADTGKFHDPFIHQVIVGIIGLIFGPLAGLVYMHLLLRYLLFIPIHALIRYYHEKNEKMKK